MLFKDGTLLALFFIWNILRSGGSVGNSSSLGMVWKASLNSAKGGKKVQVILKIIMKFTMCNLLAQMLLKSVVTKDS